MNVRHVSDLKVDPAGVLFIAAATDPGDDGPFQSAVYVAGVFDVDDTGVALRQNSQLVSLSRFDAHKVERTGTGARCSRGSHCRHR